MGSIRRITSKTLQIGHQDYCNQQCSMVSSDHVEAGWNTAQHDQSKTSHKERTMKVWSKPQVREQEVGLEVTSYLPAEIDII